jgi:hypothetical protein
MRDSGSSLSCLDLGATRIPCIIEYSPCLGCSPGCAAGSSLPVYIMACCHLSTPGLAQPCLPYVMMGLWRKSEQRRGGLKGREDNTYKHEQQSWPTLTTTNHRILDAKCSFMNRVSDTTVIFSFTSPAISGHNTLNTCGNSQPEKRGRQCGVWFTFPTL